MPAKVEFFYDYSSPWTYLAFTRIEELCRGRGAELEWRPILVGGIFNTVNPSVYESRERPVPAKARYMAKDLKDWADYYGLTIRFPPAVFPMNSVKSLRGALVALDKMSGKEQWRSPGINSSWNTPLLVTTPEKGQELVVSIQN